jgi:hypothetical protein
MPHGWLSVLPRKPHFDGAITPEIGARYDEFNMSLEGIVHRFNVCSVHSQIVVMASENQVDVPVARFGEVNVFLVTHVSNR